MKKAIYLVLSFALVLSSCKSDDDKKDDVQADFDQAGFLSNLSDNIIYPSYTQLQLDVEALKNSIDSLAKYENQNWLDQAQADLKKSYLSWQAVSFLEFGPAMTIGLRSELNVFPTDSNQIENNISNANFDLSQLANKSAKGFPAADYLLNGFDDQALIMQLNQNRKDYLKAVANDLKSKVDQVHQNWGSYRSSFKSSLGTDVGSSSGQLVNALNQHFERFFRDGKIGIPIGVRSSGIARPNDVEARFGKYSMELARANFAAMKRFYQGGSGLGLDDYLKAAGAESVDQTIQFQMQTIELKLNVIQDPLLQAIKSQDQQLRECYQEIQKLIVYWKVDLPSRLGILITYQDNDGD